MEDVFPTLNEFDSAPPVVELIPPTSLEAMERASIDVQVRTAKAFPRGNPKAIQQRIASIALMDPETAASCFYTLKRDGKIIQGPSVRLVEIAVNQWGNIRAGARVVDIDKKFITAQGVCHDLETNTLVTSEVRRRITTKEGRTYSDDMQTTTANAACSIAFRNAGLKVIPRAVFGPVYERCMEVALGKAKSTEQMRGDVIEAYAKMGVSVEQLLVHLELETEEQIGMEHFKYLLGLSQSLRDGETTISEEFPPITKKGAPKRETNAGSKPSPAPSSPTPAEAPKPKAEEKKAAAEEKPNEAPVDPLAAAEEAAETKKPEASPAESAAADDNPDAPRITTQQYDQLMVAAGNDQNILLDAIKPLGYKTAGEIPQSQFFTVMTKVSETAKEKAKTRGRSAK